MQIINNEATFTVERKQLIKLLQSMPNNYVIITVVQGKQLLTVTSKTISADMPVR